MDPGALTYPGLSVLYRYVYEFIIQIINSNLYLIIKRNPPISYYAVNIKIKKYVITNLIDSCKHITILPPHEIVL